MPSLLRPPFTTLLLAQSTFGFSFSVYFVLPKFLDLELGAGPAEIGAVMLAYGVATVACVPAMGAAVDRYGRRRFLALGGALMLVSSLPFVAVDAIGPLVYGLRAVQGLAFAMAFVAGSTLAVDLAPPERLSQALGFFGLSMLLMNAVGPAVAEGVADRAGWDPVFLLAGGAGVGSLWLTRRLPDVPLPALEGRAPSFLAVARRPASLELMAVTALTAVSFGALMTFHQPLALDRGIAHVRGFFVGYAGAAFLARGVFGGFADRFGRRPVALAALALYAAVPFAMPALQPGRLVVLGALFGVAHGFFHPAYNALFLEDVPAGERGRVMGLFNGAFNAGYALLALPLGWIGELFGFTALFVCAGACTSLAFGILALGGRRARRGRAEASS